MGSSDAYEHGVITRELENVMYSVIYLHFQTEATPYLFHKFLSRNAKRRSSFQIDGVVFCVANGARAKFIGNHCTRVHWGGVVFRKRSGVVFCCSRCVQFHTMKRRASPHCCQLAKNYLVEEVGSISRLGVSR